MTREDVIRMAREAGFADDGVPAVKVGLLARFAALVAAEEREACAKLCEALGERIHGRGRDDSEAFDCADAIRTRVMNDRPPPPHVPRPARSPDQP